MTFETNKISGTYSQIKTSIYSFVPNVNRDCYFRAFFYVAHVTVSTYCLHKIEANSLSWREIIALRVKTANETCHDFERVFDEIRLKWIVTV